MGLSIHYSGTIKNRDLIPPMVEEVKDICNALQWSVHIIDDKQFTGIIFSPEKCEPLFFTFSKKGKLCSPIFSASEIQPAISVKTQFAGIEVHKAIIRLLQYLSVKYFTQFHLFDEGNYWETNDEEILKRQFKNYEAAFDSFTQTINDIPAKENEPERLVERIIGLINKNNK